MSSVIPFSFNAIELCVATISENLWTSAKEACRALGYGKATEASHVIKAHVSLENTTQKYQTVSMSAANTPINWPKDSKKYDIYINEEGMYELVFGSQQPKAKAFRKHCCNVLFSHVRQQLPNKIQEKHQQAIEEKNN